MQDNSKSSRTWISPLTGISFFVISVTGIFMLFHARIPGMKALHELGGILFVIAAAWHLILNWKPFLSCCRQKAGRLALCTGVLITVMFLLVGIGHDNHHGRNGGGSQRQEENPGR